MKNTPPANGTDTTPRLDSLGPGSVITQEQVESMIGLTREADADRFGFKLMSLTDQVRREMARPDLTVVNRNHGIVVLTHPEASEYNATAFARGLSKSRAAHRRMQGVDVGKLTDAEKRAHERKMLSQSRILSAVRGARAEIQIEQEDECPANRG